MHDLRPDSLSSNLPLEAPLSLGEYANRKADETVFERYIGKKAEETKRRQKADLASFFSYLTKMGYGLPIDTFLDTQDWSLWSGVSYGLVEGFVMWMVREGFAVGTIRLRLSTVKTYSHFAWRARAISQETYHAIKAVESYSHKEGLNLDEQRPVTRVGRKKEKSTILNDLTRSQLRQAGRLKDQALIAILLDHGLRCSEVSGMLIEDINFEAGTFSFNRKKVKKTQTHSFMPEPLRLVQDYVRTLQRKEGPLFEGHNHTPMSTQGINKRVGELGEMVGVTGLSPHDLRHDWATRIARKKKTELKAFVTAGGWTTPAMALRYIEESAIANEGVVLD